jgi:Helix-turn-helix domain
MADETPKGVKPLTWARAIRDHRDFGHATLQTAFTLLTHANGDTGEMYPSLETLASETGLSIAAVKRHRAELVKCGWLVELWHGGSTRQLASRYMLTIPAWVTKLTGEPSHGQGTKLTDEPSSGRRSVTKLTGELTKLTGEPTKLTGEPLRDPLRDSKRDFPTARAVGRNQVGFASDLASDTDMAGDTDSALAEPFAFLAEPAEQVAFAVNVDRREYRKLGRSRLKAGEIIKPREWFADNAGDYMPRSPGDDIALELWLTAA